MQSKDDWTLESRALKAVRFNYVPTPQTVELLETFRTMINHAIQICLDERIRGRLRLRNRIYREFRDKYGVMSGYPYSVAEVAWSIVKKHRRWQRKPFAARLMMKLDASKFSLNYSILSLPFRTGEPHVTIPLQYGNYQRSFLLDTTLNIGSITMTDSAIIIAFSKKMALIKPLGNIGYDLNEKSIVGSDGTKINLSEVARLHTEYGIRRSDSDERHPNDRRLRQKFANSRREKERVKQLLHMVSKQIVDKAKADSKAIVLERLSGIRNAHLRDNGERKGKRRRIALWPFGQLQKYIAYKAAWEGVQVKFVSPYCTSQICHRCKFVNRKLKPTEREWQCPSCGAILDRDLNAAINIEYRGRILCLGEVRPGARGKDEAVRGNEQTTAPILRAEALKLGKGYVPTT